VTRRGWLAPFGALFGGGAALRAALYERGLFPRTRLKGPVISVGNLSAGGRGKTPVVERLARILQEDGLPISILSRGYHGSFRGDVLIVGDGRSVLAGASEAGDEPVMLAQSLPGVVVAVGPRRDRVGRAVEERFGPRVHILDDGFQHFRLMRDLDLVCASPQDLEDRPLPAGCLREFPSAIGRADLVFLTSEAAHALTSERVFLLGRRIEGFFGVDGAPHPPPRRPFLLSGIAGPERFEADVRSQVVEVAGTWAFPDHHPFSAADIQGVVGRARSLGADAIVTTAKDAVRVAHTDMPLLVLRISAEIRDEARFRERLLAVARRAA
jgi:tetraacyldisaccharide 4'-kinase